MSTILIYQMGKVGSAAIRDSLTANGIENYQVHYLQNETVQKLKTRHLELGMKIPPHILRSELIIGQGLLSKGDFKIVSLIRDPVARNLSAFFQNIELYYPNGSYKGKSSEELIETFMTKYSHNISINWFDNEFKNTLGIDICDGEFDKSLGNFSFEKSGVKILLLKVESDDLDKTCALKKFLGLGDDFELLKTNIGDDKYYAEQYKAFKNRIKIPEEYLDKMYNSRLITSFYDSESISKMRQKWVR